MVKRLGRGLGALLGHTDDSDPQEIPSGDLQKIPLRNIDPNPYQPREDFDAEEMASLVQSIHQHGVLQPIVVRPLGDRFQLVAGERRLRAALEAGLEDMPARVLELDDRKIYEVALVENLQRQDLNALEKARAFQDFLRIFGISQEELAKALGINRSTVANLIRLLDLPQEVQGALRVGRITAGHARALLPLGDEAEQIALARRIAEESLSVRDVEAWVSQRLHRDSAEGFPELHSPIEDGPTATPASAKHPHLQLLEDQLRSALGARVEIKAGSKGRGRIVIHFSSHDEFERLLRELCPPSHHVAVVG